MMPAFRDLPSSETLSGVSFAKGSAAESDLSVLVFFSQHQMSNHEIPCSTFFQAPSSPVGSLGWGGAVKGFLFHGGHHDRRFKGPDLTSALVLGVVRVPTCFPLLQAESTAKLEPYQNIRNIKPYHSRYGTSLSKEIFSYASVWVAVM
eukprot:6491983-Amphidinium_carterae.1